MIFPTHQQKLMPHMNASTLHGMNYCTASLITYLYGSFPWHSSLVPQCATGGRGFGDSARAANLPAATSSVHCGIHSPFSELFFMYKLILMQTTFQKKLYTCDFALLKKHVSGHLLEKISNTLAEYIARDRLQKPVVEIKNIQSSSEWCIH